jgi:CYTH domain-containing protein
MSTQATASSSVTNSTETELKYRVIHNAKQYDPPLYYTKPSGSAGAVLEITQRYCDITNPDLFTMLAQLHPVFSEQLIGVKISELRWRSSTDLACNQMHTITAKTKGDLSRTEVEKIVTVKVTEHLEPFFIAKPITKTRVHRGLPGLICAEVDLYGEHLNGLITIEVEYDPSKQSREEVDTVIRKHFERDGTSLLDVTEDRRYKNANLARIESIDELNTVA